MNYEGLLQSKVFWVDGKNICEGTLSDFNDRWGCIEECCSPRGVEPRWHLQEVDAWVVGDFHEKVRDGDVSGRSLEYLRRREEFFFNPTEAEDAGNDGYIPYISYGRLWAVCCWNPDGSREFPYVYGDRREALEALEKMWKHDIWNNDNAPMPHWEREDAEAELRELLEDEEAK